MPFVEGLAAGSAHAPTRPRPCMSANGASARSRSSTTTSAIRAIVTRERIAAGPAVDLAVRRPAAGVRRGGGRPGRRVYAAGPRRSPGRGARPGRAVDQKRHAQPDRVVQGPGGVGGAHQGPGARLQGGRLRLNRQPGQLGGGPRGPRRHGVGGVHPGRPGSRQGGHDGGVRRPPGRGGRQLRRRQPAVRRAGRRAPVVGVRQRQRAHLLRRGLQDAGLRGGRTARAGRPRTTWWCPWRRAAS